MPSIVASSTAAQATPFCDPTTPQTALISCPAWLPCRPPLKKTFSGPKLQCTLRASSPATLSFPVMQLAGQRCVLLARMPGPVSRERVPRRSSCPALHRRRLLRHRVLHCPGAGLRRTLRHDAPTHGQRRVSASTPVFTTCFITHHFLLPQVPRYPLCRVPVLRLRRHPARLPAR